MTAKDEYIRVRLSAQDKEVLRAEADKRGVKMTTLIELFIRGLKTQATAQAA